jgi:hypothetical protein
MISIFGYKPQGGGSPFCVYTAVKNGSTSIRKYILGHVIPSAIKEAFLINDIDHYEILPYRSFLAREVIRKRLKNPELVKKITVIRDPIQRFISAYKMIRYRWNQLQEYTDINQFIIYCNNKKHNIQ